MFSANDQSVLLNLKDFTMSRIIKDQGVVALAKIILKLAEQTGSEAALKIIESSPEVFINLLSSKNYISDNLTDLGVPKKVISQWNKENAEENIEKLKLTKYQSIILFSMLKHKNAATLADLIKEFENRNIEVGTGSVIGGSLAGISKKCVSCGIPKVFKTVKGKDNLDTYSIVTVDENTVKVFKKCLQQFIGE